ncbi:MAG: thioredoxin domain-containing protein [Pegethrix bostrychoides GSE-TBD4-15B]|jgi:hypothetical protein|uniref:Thioredoxin domain-containing protein n=1 Tax=Pegethrix bostrychoides GSE-TBD4-15B TaxID=2839662 RepID=A0A951PGJ3_9CYAN|nr:thioredoxin domain-containing protein [Pegethrix bostrychoides GSE-TBD4-15B]
MPNRLAQAQSLYLRKHAENPIDWWPWCDQALALARQQNKPIFLSIGYSSCHWCTVMEGEAFSDLQVAAYMNAQFLPIKVDREERPDLDSIYMQALQLLTGQGGWPLNVFLSPVDLVPFYGGTYFPQQPKYNRPGFLQLLQALRNFYDTEAEKLDTVKGEILQRLQQNSGQNSQQNSQQNLGPDSASELNQELLLQGLDYSAKILSSRGAGTCFPMIPYAATALRGIRFAAPESDALTPEPAQMLVTQQRGLDLALGGIYDHVAGGWHRYTVDPGWTVPHFEKMLYDNGQIVEYLADLWAAGMQEPAFERAIRGTVGWLKREMTAPAGYFYAAQDADSFLSPDQAEPEEGAFYVWRYDELTASLSADELAALSAEFTVTPSGNFESQNVLQRRSPGQISAQTEAILAKLFALRYGKLPDAVPSFPPAGDSQAARTQPWPGRIPAVTDTKMIVAWNSLMISGLARAAAVFQQLDYFELAAGAAKFLLTHQRVAGRLHRLNYDVEQGRQPSVMAQSEDYALLIKALLDLDQTATGLGLTDSNWLEQAVEIQAEFDTHLWSLEGGYYNTKAQPDLLVREHSCEDNATPSANGVAATNLVRLFLQSEQTAYLDRAEQSLQAFSAVMQQAPQSCPSLFAALDWWLHLTLVQSSPGRLAGLAAQYLPTVVYRPAFELPAEAVALVCQGLSCQEPARSEAEMWQQIQQSLRR